jgi:AcrR family transcriptional regulator
VSSIAPPARRTQRQRRESTIAALVSATIEAVVELGYPRASVKEICRRAGVSEGALFRHFATRLDLVVLAAEEISRQQLAWFIENYQRELQDGGDAVATGVKVMRQAARRPINRVWYELVVSARTDRALFERLQPSIAERYRRAAEFATGLLGNRYPEDFITPLMYTLIHLFNGEAMAEAVYPTPELNEQQITAIIDAVTGAFASG